MIGIIGALDIEVQGLIANMKDPKETVISTIAFVSGTIEGVPCVVARCGIGKVNAALCAQTMILSFHPCLIINTGIAGGTSDKTRIGTLVTADRLVQHDMDTTILGDEVGTIFLAQEQRIYFPCCEELNRRLTEAAQEDGITNLVCGTIATGDRFIGSFEDRRTLFERFGAVACEMEGGSIAQVCFINGVPFTVLRSISDDSSGDSGVEYATFSRSAAQMAVRLLMTFLDRLDPEDPLLSRP